MIPTAGTHVVTGGAGFIGHHLVERLVASGCQVRVIEHPRADCDHLPGSVEVVRADIRDRRALRPALVGARYVYHLAANPNLWARCRAEFAEVNYHGTVHVVEAALAAGAERILHTSTESILTRRQSTEPIGADVEVPLSEALGPYCRSKLLAERYALAGARTGLPIWVANPTMPIGPGDRGLSPPTRLIRDFGAGRLPGWMDGTLNVIDVRDAAEGLVRTLHRGQPGRRYLLGGQDITIGGLLGILAELTGRPMPTLTIPYALGLGFAWLSERWADLWGGQHPMATVTGVQLTRRSMMFQVGPSLRALGLHPRSLRESLTQTLLWLQEIGQISRGTQVPVCHGVSDRP